MQEVYQERYEKKNTNHLSNVTSNFLWWNYYTRKLMKIRYEKNQSIPGVFVCWFLSINAVVLYLEYDLKIDKKDLRLDSTHV